MAIHCQLRSSVILPIRLVPRLKRCPPSKSLSPLRRTRILIGSLATWTQHLMKYSTSIFGCTAVLISQVYALSTPRSLPFASLNARTISPSIIPAACQATCLPIINAANQCNSVASCYCTASIGTSLTVCVDCVVSLAPTAIDIAAGQAELNAYDKDCIGYGLPPHVVTVGGSTAAVPESASATASDVFPSASVVGAPTSVSFPTGLAGITKKSGADSGSGLDMRAGVILSTFVLLLVW